VILFLDACICAACGAPVSKTKSTRLQDQTRHTTAGLERFSRATLLRAPLLRELSPGHASERLRVVQQLQGAVHRGMLRCLREHDR